jgi:mitochondrial import inner membrane translocase subunit TIM17
MEGREPCPYRIVDDVGGAFCMGAIGGGIWHFFKGMRNAPKGQRLIGALYAVKARSPVLGGERLGVDGRPRVDTCVRLCLHKR